MVVNGITQEAFISMLEVKLGTNYTDEQKELITKFGDGPVFCFADPGTGKTFTAIGGLINAECFKQIPGNNIYALSFTKLATGELAVRHERTCQKLGITKNVNFQTLHSLCRTILKDNYKLLGMQTFNTSGALTMEKAYTLVRDSCLEWGISLEPNQIKGAIKAASSLNAALIFDKDIVVTKMKFKEARMDYETFDKIRGLLFSYSLLSDTISVSDLLLYTVMLLQRHPEISEAFKKKCQLMLVDEAQDLSLLQLRIISLLTDNPVLIGDMKQQIYGFNGACQEIVEEFHKLYPTAQTLKLTQSFRCKNAIADYATKLILANKIGGEDYKGVGDGGQVFMHCGLYENGLNLPKLVDNLHAEYVGNRNMFSKEYLFLTRNNISIIPIIEALYQKKLPFRVNKFQRAYDIPVIKDLCEIIKLAQSPANIQNILSLRYLLPEFKGIRNLDEHPLYQACRQTGADIFTINYSYRNVGLAGKVMEALIQVHDNIETATMGQLINIIWPFYEETWLSSTSWMLENKPEYYMLAVDQLLGKTYANFINDEVDKDNIINECERYGRGVRCYTMHASKGLEADVVYILDADQGLLPNVKKLDDMIKKNCEIDAARQIREERSLCYVACTRAKDELHIIYNEQPAALIMGENPYSMYDHIYETYKPMGDDIGAFTNFLERYVPCQN